MPRRLQEHVGVALVALWRCGWADVKSRAQAPGPAVLGRNAQFRPDHLGHAVLLDGVPAPAAAHCLDQQQPSAAFSASAPGSARVGGRGLASATRTSTRALSDSSHSRTGQTGRIACEATTLLATNSETTCPAVSPSQASPHSRTTA